LEALVILLVVVIVIVVVLLLVLLVRVGAFVGVGAWWVVFQVQSG